MKVRSTGSVHKRGNRWSIVVSNYTDPRTGESRQQKWFSYGHVRKRDALDQMHDLLAQINSGTHIVAAEDPLGDWLDTWLEMKRPKYGIRTYEGHSSVIRVHLNPALGDVPLVDLTPQHLERYYIEKRKQLSEKTLEQHHSILSSALKSAVRKRLIAENPCPLVENKPKADPKEMKTWTPAQLQKFLETALKESNLQIYLFFRLIFETGCRRGEVAALRWTDIEFDEKRTVIHVRRTLVKPTAKPVFGPPKKHQRRRIAISHDLAKLLREHRSAQNKLKLQLGGQYNDFGLVFAKGSSSVEYLGCPLQVNNIGKRVWKKIIDEAELPYIRIHDLRHTSATLQLPHTNIKQVQKRLGHKRIETTLNIYAHAIPELDEAVADVLGAVAGEIQGSR